MRQQKASSHTYQHSPGKTATILQNLTDFGSVLHPQDEAMDDAVLVVNPNLPTAPRRDISGHAAISVRDCIKDMLAYGVPIELYGT
jgi:hypothetical protein